MLGAIHQVLDKTSALHQALSKQREDQIKQQVLELNLQIETLLGGMGDFQLQNQAMHLKRILQSTRRYLDSFENQGAEEPKLQSLKLAFSQLVQIVRMYPVDKKYQVFYCKADNSEWVQEGGKPANPIHPDRHGTCGQRAYR